jgi:membrane associated rhomboid family serine protease
MDHNAPPLNPLPPVAWALALPMIAIELIVNLGARGVIGGQNAVGWRLQLIDRFGFFPDLLRQQIEVAQYPAMDVARLVTYPFMHAELTSAVFAAVMTLALAKVVGEVFRWWATLIVFFGAVVLAALVYTAIPILHDPLIGAFPGVYGLIGAFTFLMWVRLAAVGANQMRAFSLIGFLLATQLLFGLLFGGGTMWVAELTGFVAGFMLSLIVSPGGWARMMDRLRAR